MASDAVAGSNNSSQAATPFIHRRRVRWGDSDPAAIAYTARLPEMCMDAIEAWYRERMGYAWYEQTMDLGLGTPFVHMSLDFRRAVTPRQELGLRVLLTRMGGSSLHFLVTAAPLDDPAAIAFEGRFVAAFVKAGVLKAIPVPERFRAVLAREVAIAAAVAPPDEAPAARVRRGQSA